jgi:hypothetical protein
MLEMLMMEPPPVAAMHGPAAAIIRKGPLRFTSMTLSKSFSLTSLRSEYNGERPAQFTRTSSRPEVSLAMAADAA